MIANSGDLSMMVRRCLLTFKPFRIFVVGIGFFSLCFLMTSLGGQFSAKRPGDPPFTVRAEGKLLRLCPAPIMTRLAPLLGAQRGSLDCYQRADRSAHSAHQGSIRGSSAHYTSISLSPSFPALATSTSRALFDLHPVFLPVPPRMKQAAGTLEERGRRLKATP
ncbi:Alpha-1,6-mannosylglycoprotein 6-beta-N-acetylglucosaminyltransferase B [Takifugu flavidus]|uniref:Alpha-1,6-mannosylglycoprotein 6-beta-N-acetylglucosaminyltransferase B n=1 Tax=Takifugu flavidus TaxID=433684 RepID=A0A5C6NSR4_9TELE|nr:Alpha-1,6-mannosylglycoprotein 6-beta-N-acetylglucosaminyltransferase B [Takifugu flavidus]